MSGETRIMTCPKGHTEERRRCVRRWANCSACGKAYREATREKRAAYYEDVWKALPDDDEAKLTKKAYDKAYKEANREKIAACGKAYREATREKKAAYDKAYHEANREKTAAYSKAWYEANREKKNARRRARRALLKEQKQHGSETKT